MPVVPVVVVILAGLALIWLAVVSWRERLPRNGLAGVRTRSTMRSDEAFRVANKVAAPLSGAGGAVMILGGALAVVLPRHVAPGSLFGGVVIGAVLCVIGAMQGVRACRERVP